MPYTGSAPTQTYQRTDGVRTGTAVNAQAKAAAVNDTAALADARENDLADAINLLLLRNGGNQPSANLPMNSFKHTGVAVASARTDYARASQVQDSSLIYGGTAGGTANAITLDLTPNITAYAAGLMILFKAAADNTDDDVTVNADNVGNATLFKFDGATKPAVGDIQNGGMYLILHDGTNFCLVGAIGENLNGLANLTAAADRLAYFTGANGAMALATFTAAGRALVDDADASAQRTTLGLGTMALETAANYLTKADNLGSVASAATAFGNIKQAASDTATGVLEIADKSEMEAASSTTLAVTPGRQHNHPAMPKFWLRAAGGGSPSLTESHNVTSISDDGTGLLGITIATDFTTTTWAAIGGSMTGAIVLLCTFDNQAAGTIRARSSRGSDGTLFDPDDWRVVGFGDQ
jgi:hypothetical protein